MGREKDDSKALRTIAILQGLAPKRYRTVQEIWALLQQQGFTVGKRTVERNLEELAQSHAFGSQIECLDNAKPYRWRLSKDCDLFLPALDTDLAATWDLVGHYLEYLLPDAAQRKLEPEINSARRYLKRHCKSAWSNKVAFLPRNLLRPAKVLPAVREAVFDALVEGSQLAVTYCNKDGTVRETVLHLQGIVHRVTVSYVVAMWNDYDDIRHLALHRIQKARKLSESARTKADFSLAEYIKTGMFDINASGTCHLRLRFYNYAGNHLDETPLSGAQKLTPLDAATIECEAVVPDTQELRWWILGFGQNVEVLEPESLRTALGKQLLVAAQRYGH